MLLPAAWEGVTEKLVRSRERSLVRDTIPGSQARAAYASSVAERSTGVGLYIAVGEACRRRANDMASVQFLAAKSVYGFETYFLAEPLAITWQHMHLAVVTCS